MSRLGFIDLEILFLGIKGNGNFNEQDIENSNLKRLGVGRILDSLASLKERKLIDLNKDGTFSITDLSRHILWDEKMPLWIRILRLLEIKSFSIEEISKFLKKTSIEVFEEIEKLRKNQFVLMSPQRIEEKIIKIYEILPEGKEKLKDVEIEGFEKHNINANPQPEIEIAAIVNQVIKEINDLEIEFKTKEEITTKLSTIKEKLKI